jgi:hypothetical protein
VGAIQDRRVTVTIDGSQRRVQLADTDLESLRLAYAQHVYRQQGATVERSIVLTGGWQTSNPERLNPGWEPSRNPLRLRSALSPTRWLNPPTPNRDRAPDHGASRGR